MSTTFDFGSGPVPAHRHPNGGGWVADTARVDDSAYIGPAAQVFGNAQVSGGAKLAKSSDYLLIGPIGSRAAFMTWTRSDNCIATGCFRGTIKEFLAAVRETHGDNEHAQAYRAAVEFIRAMEKQP